MEKERGKLRSDNIKAVALAIAIAMLTRAYVAQAYHIPSGSMENTLLVGDHVLVEKISGHVSNPARGDIVVFNSPVEEKVLIKRVIGLPGETVSMEKGAVSINGKPITEPYLHPLGGAIPFGVSRSFPPLKVPTGAVFVMGDNRDNSGDSRLFGPVPISHIIGRALAIHWSWKDRYHVRWDRLGTSL